MKLDINDYLPFYSKQWCMVKEIIPTKLIEGNNGMYILSFNIMQLSATGELEVKPIVRPLSTMTDEERHELAMQSVLPCEWRDDREYALRTKYLLSKSFDLFGLLDAGLAVLEPEPVVETFKVQISFFKKSGKFYESCVVDFVKEEMHLGGVKLFDVVVKKQTAVTNVEGFTIHVTNAPDQPDSDPFCNRLIDPSTFLTIEANG